MGLVKEHAEKIARAICPELGGGFRVAELDADTLAHDPARLNDEAASLSLMGGRRLVRVHDAGVAVGGLFDRFSKIRRR